MTAALERTADPVAADANAYRTFLSVDDVPDIIDRATSQLGSWLREKGWDVSLAGDAFHERDDAELLVLHRESGEGSAFRARLVETTTVGVWRTQLTVFEPHTGPAWIALEVVNSESRFVAVPRIAGYLMDSLPTRDGGSLLTSTARIIGSNDVDSVITSILDPRRQGLYLVAGTSRVDIDLEKFRQQVDRWGRQVRGLAQVVVLNADATADLANAFGDSHGVQPWTIRTFRPGTDPTDPDDGLRHRFLSTRRLANDPTPAIVALLSRVARRHAAQRTPPDGYTRLDRAFARIENSLLFDAVTKPVAAAPAAPTQAERLVAVPAEPEVATEVEDAERTDTASPSTQRALDLVKIVLGIDEVTEERLQAIADDAERGRRSAASLDRIRTQLEKRELQIDALNDEIKTVRSDYEDAVVDAAIAEIDGAKRADEIRWLRGRLAELEDFGGAYGPPPGQTWTEYPENFAELSSRLGNVGDRKVVFTGDLKIMVELDEYDDLGRFARLAWDALLVLADYVRARVDGKCDSGLKNFLENTPQGFRSVPPNKFAEGETAATMAAHGDTRIFPVPTTADPTGRATMGAHFKLGKLGRISPRLHFVDCWPIDGRVYVGYIGRHLPLASD